MITRRKFLSGIAAAGVALSAGAHLERLQARGLILPTQARGGYNLAGAPPMDILAGSSWTCTYGLAALTYRWWNGKPLCDFIVGSNTYTLKTKNGYPDVQYLKMRLPNIWLALQFQGALCSKWYDQSGLGNDATQGTTANQAAIWLVNGEVSMFFSGCLSVANSLPAQYFDIPTSAAFDAQSISIFSVVANYTSTSTTSEEPNSGESSIFAIQNLSSDGMNLYTASGYVTPYPYGGIFDRTSGNFGGGDPNTFGNNKNVTWGISDGGSLTGGCNDTFTTTGGAGVSTYTGGRIGALPTAASNQPYYPGGFSGRMYCLMVASTKFDTTDALTITNALYTWANIRKSSVNSPINMVMDGASWTAGQGGDVTNQYLTQNGGGYGHWNMITDALAQYGITINNMSESGNSIQDCINVYGDVTSGAFNASAAKNILVGPNDGAGTSMLNGETGAQAYTDYTNYLSTVRAQSWDVLMTTLGNPNIVSGYTQYNSLVISNASANDMIPIDLSASPLPGSGAPWYNPTDGHPTIFGYVAYFGEILPYVLPHI